MSQNISQGRKNAYYFGLALSILGGLMFASNFVLVGVNVGNFGHLDNSPRYFIILGFGGMALIVLGSFIRRLGALGPAGSGMILDPKEARQDLEPYSRMAGGMVKDALAEADLSLGAKPAEQVVKVRCTHCHQLNDETAKFCQQCGQPL